MGKDGESGNLSRTFLLFLRAAPIRIRGYLLAVLLYPL